ncbi:hypothetical protein AB0H34_11870 [Saccharopolyspora shandongensis]|uniref:hypothetical protein n=1 Tax=Saccharopolyspora shandongensis TaxID=418495 RepID=UPI0033FA7B3E
MRRRAEVAEAATEPGEPAPGTGSHRDRFDRALRRLEAECFDARGDSEDRVEGPEAFAEKRKPVWKGR